MGGGDAVSVPFGGAVVFDSFLQEAQGCGWYCDSACVPCSHIERNGNKSQRSASCFQLYQTSIEVPSVNLRVK